MRSQLQPGLGLGFADTRPAARAERERLSISSTTIDVARAIQADATVLGTRGRGGIKSVLLGSASQAVLANADRPTLVIPLPQTTATEHPRPDQRRPSR
jgi:nucleotide-binding universal stress UspA family protein